MRTLRIFSTIVVALMGHAACGARIEKSFQQRLFSAANSAKIDLRDRTMYSVYGVTGVQQRLNRAEVLEKQKRWKIEVTRSVQIVAESPLGQKLFNCLAHLWERAAPQLSLVLWPAHDTCFRPDNYKSPSPRLDMCFSGPFGPQACFDAVAPRSFVGYEQGSVARSVCLVNTTALSSLDREIVHELLHMKHFLEAAVLAPPVALPTVPPARADERIELIGRFLMEFPYKKAIRTTPHDLMALPELEPYTPEVYTYLPELRTPRLTPLWANFEERRTVCGPDRDSIKANDYAASMQSPLRYIYQQYGPLFDYEQTVQAVFGPAAYAVSAFDKNIQWPGLVDAGATPFYYTPQALLSVREQPSDPRTKEIWGRYW